MENFKISEFYCLKELFLKEGEKDYLLNNRFN